jgi:uncharacterized protein (DUF4415 family)
MIEIKTNAAEHATKLSAVQREMPGRINQIGIAIAQARNTLATLLLQHESGRPVKPEAITAAREALGQATRDHADATLMVEVMPLILDEARQQAQLNRNRALPARDAARHTYTAAMAALDRDWMTLSRQNLRARGVAILKLSQQAGWFSKFKESIEAWQERINADTLIEII